MNKNIIFNKNAIALKALAIDFISMTLDSKIKTISEYESIIDVARGTIQNSINILKETKAVTLKSRGSKGTFLINKNLQKLLEFAQISFLIGAMPLPYSKLYEGLSTGLLKTMENNLNIPVNMAYMRGAYKRIDMVVNERYDFAIVSKFAVKHYLEKKSDIEIIKEFGKQSYLNNHVIMFNDKNFSAIKDNMKVGIDYDSIDQVYLTQKICKNINVKYINLEYNQLIDKLKSKEIDVAIWNGDEVNKNSNEIYFKKINLDNDDNTIAVVIISKKRKELKSLLNDLINIEEIQNIQKLIINNELIPSY